MLCPLRPGGKPLEIKLSVWQTPTAVTDRILQSEDPVNTYFEWARAEHPEDIYYDRDDETQPLVIAYNLAENHIGDLLGAIEEYKAIGCSLRVEGY